MLGCRWERERGELWDPLNLTMVSECELGLVLKPQQVMNLENAPALSHIKTRLARSVYPLLFNAVFAFKP